MIARIWRGVTPASKADRYLDYLNSAGVPDGRATDGNEGVYVFRRVEDDRAHFLFVSFRDSIGAIEKFAGPEVEKARYYPEDEQFLLELEPLVQHFDVSVKP